MSTVLELVRRLAKPIHVLIAESDTAQANAIADCLASYNVEIVRVNSTASALAEIKQLQFDIAFIDLVLQDQLGVPILMALQSANVPAVIMFGCLDYQVVNEACEACGSSTVAFLKKPLDAAGKNVGSAMRLFNLRVTPKSVSKTIIIDGTVASDTYRALDQACP